MARVETRENTWSFEQIYDEYKTPIYNYVYHLVGDREQADDLTQDTFLKAFLALPKMDANLNLSAWLYRIAKNVAIDYFRRIKKIPVSLDVLPYEVERNLPDEDSVLAYMHFEQVLFEMPEQQRKCLQLLADGLSYEEIASCLKLELGTVLAYVSKGRKKLRISFFGVTSKKPASRAIKSSVKNPVLQFSMVEGNSLSENPL